MKNTPWLPGISLSRFAFGRELEGHSNYIEKALEIKTRKVQ
jgi:hypothetical protein